MVKILAVVNALGGSAGKGIPDLSTVTTQLAQLTRRLMHRTEADDGDKIENGVCCNCKTWMRPRVVLALVAQRLHGRLSDYYQD